MGTLKANKSTQHRPKYVLFHPNRAQTTAKTKNMKSQSLHPFSAINEREITWNPVGEGRFSSTMRTGWKKSFVLIVYIGKELQLKSTRRRTNTTRTRREIIQLDSFNTNKDKLNYFMFLNTGTLSLLHLRIFSPLSRLILIRWNLGKIVRMEVGREFWILVLRAS